MTDTAIAKRDESRALTKPKQISQALVAFQDESKFHLLGPQTHLGEIPIGTSLSIRELRVDPKDESQVYKVGHGKVALSGTVLDKAGGAAGVSVVESTRTDDRRHPHYFEFSVRVKVTDLDGSVREEVGTKTVDLRDDAGDGLPGADRKGMSDKELGQARKFGSEICASKAKNRAVAHLLGIRRSYLPAELAKPFILPKLVPDAANPASQQAVLANMMGASAALFGAPQPAPVVDAVFEVESETPAEAPATAATVPGADAEPAHDADGEALGTTEVGTIIDGAWARAKKSEVDADTFRKICQTQTGCQNRGEMTATQAASVALAVDAYIANRDDGAPV